MIANIVAFVNTIFYSIIFLYILHKGKYNELIGILATIVSICNIRILVYYYNVDPKVMTIILFKRIILSILILCPYCIILLCYIWFNELSNVVQILHCMLIPFELSILVDHMLYL
jgi:hypothetical protein